MKLNDLDISQNVIENGEDKIGNLKRITNHLRIEKRKSKRECDETYCIWKL